jgi:Holliday junction DNA helicase RuvA
MLSRITGVLERLDANTATVSPAATGPDGAPAPGPIAYDVLVPAALAEDLAGSIKQTVTLHTVQHFEGSGQGASLTPRLIGFASRSDRAFFELFTTVKGVGPRKALRSMVVPCGQIALAIAQGDKAALKKLPEIGERLAATIVAELAGKAERYVPTGIEEGKPRTAADDAGAQQSAAAESEHARQAIEALVRLGTPRAEAERRVARALESDPALARADAAADRILTAALTGSG